MNFTHPSEHDRVDELLLTYMGPDEAYIELVGEALAGPLSWPSLSVVKLLLVLSHDQACRW